MAKCTKESASTEKVNIYIYSISNLQFKEIVLTFPFLRLCLHFLIDLDTQKNSFCSLISRLIYYFKI